MSLAFIVKMTYCVGKDPAFKV